MLNQFSYNFQTAKSMVGETYFFEGRKYLCWCIDWDNYFLDSSFPHLLIPDDNSLLASNIRNNSVGGKFFSIPFSDLKFKPKLLEYQNDKRKHLDGFLVKNTNQVKKITDQEVRSPQTLTFKVRSQKKIRKKQWDSRVYKHHLEVEPFSLGMEGLPEISQIVFSFGFGQSLENSPGSLIKTWFYNHKILEKSAGKVFSVKVRLLCIGSNYNELSLSESSTFEVDSFQEIPFKNEPDNNNSTLNQPSNFHNQNKGLIIFVICSVITVSGILILLIAKKSKK